jgi:hypothetical protein
MDHAVAIWTESQEKKLARSEIRVRDIALVALMRDQLSSDAALFDLGLKVHSNVLQRFPFNLAHLARPVHKL